MAPPDQPMMLAIERYMLNIAVPVLYDDPRHLDQLGTGTFFEHDGVHFLVTARHIFEGKAPELVVVPTSPRGPSVITLGSCEYCLAIDEPGKDIDLVVVVLRDPAVVAQLKAGWSFMNLDRTLDPSVEGDFVLCGYPSERIKVRGQDLGGTLLTCYTERLPIPNNAKQPVHPDLDVFFYFDKTATDFHGREVPAGHLKGMSGSSIWRFVAPPNDGSLWAPERSLFVVGIQTDFREGNYSRGKNWKYVRKMILDLSVPPASRVHAHEQSPVQSDEPAADLS